MSLALKIGDEFWIKKPSSGVNPGISGSPAHQSVTGFISAILPNVYIFATIILFIILLVGGLIVIASAGKGKEEGIQKGKKAITSALLGFLIIFLSYWIMQIIKVVTGIDLGI